MITMKSKIFMGEKTPNVKSNSCRREVYWLVEICNLYETFQVSKTVNSKLFYQ